MNVKRKAIDDQAITFALIGQDNCMSSNSRLVNTAGYSVGVGALSICCPLERLIKMKH